MSVSAPTCCWHQERLAPGDCPRLPPGEPELLLDRKQRFLRLCLECPQFLHDLHDRAGRPEPLREPLNFALEELRQLRLDNRELYTQSLTRDKELRFLQEVNAVLQTSFDLDEVLSMALTAITADQGFGLNRAILLLVERGRERLSGHLAVGPRDRQEAQQIWAEIAGRDESLRQMARRLLDKQEAEREKFQGLLATMCVPLAREDHLFIQTLAERRPRLVRDLAREAGLDPEQRAALGVQELALVPLVSNEQGVGLLLADNVITGRPIPAEALTSLERFAPQVSWAITRTLLNEQLSSRLERLAEAHRQLQEQQERMLRMERMALVGKITAHIAHAIRNPLTIIGGYARSLLRDTPTSDPRRAYAESLAYQARKLDTVLQEALHYAESLQPVYDRWDLNQLITNVYAEVREDLELTGIDCRLQLADPPLEARVDFRKVAHCLRSLIANAQDAMPTGGRLELHSSRCAEGIRITVSDQGRGMTPDTLAAASEPFFSTKEQSSGLGLSLCSRAMEEHGGHLQITSEPDQGTQVSLIFPTTEGGDP